MQNKNQDIGICRFPSDSNSKIFLIKEIQDEKYELKFGDGFFGKKLGEEPGLDGNIITVKYRTRF